jgi:hypothetical protein
MKMHGESMKIVTAGLKKNLGEECRRHETAW